MGDSLQDRRNKTKFLNAQEGIVKALNRIADALEASNQKEIVFNMGMNNEEVERARRMLNDGIFKHQCVNPDCTRIVEFDDEPWCFTHSPDEGSSVPGYSARARLAEGI